MTVVKEQKNSQDPLKTRFGRIAITKGFITEKQLNSAMMTKYEFEYNLLNKKKD